MKSVNEILEEKGKGICHKCLTIKDIDRGDNFFLNDEETEWLCEKCYRNYLKTIKWN